MKNTLPDHCPNKQKANEAKTPTEVFCLCGKPTEIGCCLYFASIDKAKNNSRTRGK